MKTLTYERDKIVRAVWLLNQVAFFDSKNQEFSGIQKSRAIAEIADILDNGIAGEMFEQKEKETNGDGKDMGQQTVQSH